MSTTNLLFPPALPNQPQVKISPLAGGYITLASYQFIAPCPDPEEKRTVPSLSFLITHPSGPLPNSPLSKLMSKASSSYPTSSSPPEQEKTNHPFYLLFDLGLRSSPSAYPAPLQTHLSNRKPYDLSPGIAAQLLSASSAPPPFHPFPSLPSPLPKPEDISAVILSHIHYDHHGDPHTFPSATFIVGSGALGVLENGLGKGKGSHQFFEKDLFRGVRHVELPGPEGEEDGRGRMWHTTTTETNSRKGTEGELFGGIFEHVMDLFGDGSVYLIDMPGHLPGHVNLLCRCEPHNSSTGDERERWIMLCGDAYHDRKLLTGEKSIGTWGESGCHCIHLDREKAAESILKLREFEKEGQGKVQLIAAHEEVWWGENRGRAYPGTI